MIRANYNAVPSRSILFFFFYKKSVHIRFIKKMIFKYLWIYHAQGSEISKSRNNLILPRSIWTSFDPRMDHRSPLAARFQAALPTIPPRFVSIRRGHGFWTMDSGSWIEARLLGHGATTSGGQLSIRFLIVVTRALACRQVGGGNYEWACVSSTPWNATSNKLSFVFRVREKEKRSIFLDSRIRETIIGFSIFWIYGEYVLLLSVDEICHVESNYYWQGLGIFLEECNWKEEDDKALLCKLSFARVLLYNVDICGSLYFYIVKEEEYILIIK